MDLQAVRRTCVDRFPQSITRPGIMVNLEYLIGLVNQKALNGEIWIDGSFLTEKLNTKDKWYLDDLKPIQPKHLEPTG